jgi:ribosomal protein S18 acetylase RimI-like enzyme
VEVTTTEKLPVTMVDLGPDDYAAVLALWQRAGLPVRPDGRDSPGAFARQMASGRQRLIGLRDGDRLVAVVLLTHDGRKGWINRLAVDPEYRRNGLATRLIEESERWFREEMGLEVYAALIEGGNAGSQALFARLGYAQPRLVYVSRRARPEA